MGEITREEFNQSVSKLHDKLDHISTTVIEVKTKQELMQIPKQPCGQLITHLQDHEKNIDTIRKPLIGGIIGASIVGIAGVLKYALHHFIGK